MAYSLQQVLTAHEFIAQGTSAGAVASIAAYLERETHEHKPQPDLAAHVRRVAEEVAALTGTPLYGMRGYYVPAPRRMKPANNNRRVVRRAA